MDTEAFLSKRNELRARLEEKRSRIQSPRSEFHARWVVSQLIENLAPFLRFWTWKRLTTLALRTMQGKLFAFGKRNEAKTT
jgi:hypothetical protein